MSIRVLRHRTLVACLFLFAMVFLQSFGSLAQGGSIAKVKALPPVVHQGPSPGPSTGVVPSQQPTNFAAVNNTLVLLNHTLLPGNAAVENGLNPQGLAYDAVSGFVYVTTLNDYVVCVNASTGAIVKWFTVGRSPIGIAYDPVNNFIYVDNGNSNNISAINGTSNQVVTTISVKGTNATSGSPEALAVDTVTGMLYVVTAPNTVTLVNTTTDQVVKNITVGNYPVSVYYDDVDGDVFVANTNLTNSSNVTVIDGATESVIGSIPVGLTPTGITYDKLDNRLYVTNFDSGNISVINTTTLAVVSSISLRTPSFTNGANMIATSPSGQLLYVSNYFRGVVAIVNVSTNVAVENLTVGTNPMAIAVDTASGSAFVAGSGGDTLNIVSGTVSPIVSGTVHIGTFPQGIAFDAKRQLCYIADAGSTRVMEINSSSDSYAGSVPVGYNPEYLALDSTNGLWYVTNGGSDNFSIFNRLTGAVVGSIPDSGFGLRIPTGIAYDSKNGDLYAAINGAFSSDVDVINATTNTITQRIAAHAKPYYVTYDPLNDNIYVTSLFNDLTVINGTTNTVVDNITMGLAPNGMALDINNGNLYVANAESGNVTVVDGTTNQIVGWIPVGLGPSGVAYDPRDGYIYVANSDSNNVSVIDGRTNRVVGSIPVGTGPIDLSVNPLTGDLYVTNQWSGTVSIISLPGLTSVGVFPDNQTLFTGSNTTFIAEPMCRGGICPPSVQYSWSTNNSLSVLAPTTGATTTLHAGGKCGEVLLTVIATLNGTTAEGAASVIITMLPHSSYAVTFGETGLPAGSNWSVSISTSTIYSTSPTLGFVEKNGTYVFSVSAPAGYVARPATGSLVVSGKSVNVRITFSPSTSEYGNNNPTVVDWILLVVPSVAVIVGVAVARVLHDRRRHSRSPVDKGGKNGVSARPGEHDMEPNTEMKEEPSTDSKEVEGEAKSEGS